MPAPRPTLSDALWRASSLRETFIDRFDGDERAARQHFERLSAAVTGGERPQEVTNMSSTPAPKTTTEDERDPRERFLSAMARGEEPDLDDEAEAEEYLALARRAASKDEDPSVTARRELNESRMRRASATVTAAHKARNAAAATGGRAEALGTGSADDPETISRARSFGCSPAELAALGRVPDEDADEEEQTRYQEGLAKLAARPREAAKARERRRERIAEIEAELGSPSRPGDGSPAELAQRARALKSELAKLRGEEAAAELEEAGS